MENYGSRDWELPCVCGHLKLSHFLESFGEDCGKCLFNHVHDFKLDNLALVEQVARAKGLV